MAPDGSDRTPVDSDLLRISEEVSEAYRDLLKADSHLSRAVALALGGLLSKAYLSVVLATHSGLTGASATLARVLIESAINIFCLTSLTPQEQEAECLRFIMYREVDNARYRLVQEGIAALSRERRWASPPDLQFRVEAVKQLIPEVREQDSTHPALPVLEGWSKRGLPASWSQRNLFERLEKVIAHPRARGNLVIAYRLSYQSFSGEVHGPSALGHVTRLSDEGTGSSVRIGFSRTTKSGHSTPLLASILVSADLLERYADGSRIPRQDSVNAIRIPLPSMMKAL